MRIRSAVISHPALARPGIQGYEHTTRAGGPGDAFDDEYIQLGVLKGNVGERSHRV
jgi:hypothetical protein